MIKFLIRRIKLIFDKFNLKKNYFREKKKKNHQNLSLNPNNQN